VIGISEQGSTLLGAALKHIKRGRKNMSATIMNLILQIIAGAIGGNAVGARVENASMGTAGNTIAGALGGIGGGQLLGALILAVVESFQV
jgi:hypothetical protein